MGAICMLTLIEISDSFVSSITSSTRQVVSIVLSFIIFGKPWTYRHVLAGVLFFGGLTLYFYVTNKWRAAQPKPQKTEEKQM